MAAKTGELVIREKKVRKGSTLDQYEHELAAAIVNEFEAFYQQGVMLQKICNDKAALAECGFTSFNEYMNVRQPLGIKRTRAWQLIAAKNVRPLLPNFAESTNVDSNVWTEGNIRPLTHKDFAPSDVKRLGKKIATRVKRGEQLTAALVKSICDADRGVERVRREKKDKEVFSTDTPAQVLHNIKVQVELWQSSLEEVSGDFWTDAEEDDPGCAMRASEVLSELAAYLVS